MRYAIITDTHQGVRADSAAFANYQDLFYETVFFPAVKAAGITHILHGGDFFDKRQYITVKTMERIKHTFCRLLRDYNMTMDLIVGNHDVLYRNTNDANSPSNVFKGYPEVNVISTPVEIGNILMVPWINKENYEDTLMTMHESKARFCLGHFEIVGFEMHRGQVCDGGLNSNIFSKFELTMSGHFHTRSSRSNITYLGSPFELTWADYNDHKGFHFFDDETGQLDFVQHTESMFFRVEYNRANNERMWSPYKPVNVTDKFVKVIALNKGSAYEFDKWTKELLSFGPSDLQIIESSVDVTGVEVSLEEMESQSMSNMEIIRQYVDGLSIDTTRKTHILDYMQSIYTEAGAV